MAKHVLSGVLLALVIGAVAAPGSAPAVPRLAQAPAAPATPAPPAAPTAPPTATPAGPAGITLNFDNADIETVVQALSEIVGFSYVLAPDVRGKVTVHTPRPIAREEVLSVFLSILETQGFTAIKTGELYRIVRSEKARERPIPTFIGPVPGRRVPPPPRSGAAPPPRAPDVQMAGEEVRVIPVHFADASYLAGVLREVFAGAGLARPPVIVADRATNSLVIRARRADLEAIGRLLGPPGRPPVP